VLYGAKSSTRGKVSAWQEESPAYRLHRTLALRPIKHSMTRTIYNKSVDLGVTIVSKCGLAGTGALGFSRAFSRPRDEEYRVVETYPGTLGWPQYYAKPGCAMDDTA
jgi:hypothetical protein